MKTLIYIIFICLFISCSPKLTDPNKINKPVVTANIDSVSIDMDQSILVPLILDNPKMSAPLPTIYVHVPDPVHVHTHIKNTTTQSKKISSNKNGQLVYSMADTMTVGISYKVIVRITNTNNESQIHINEGLSMVSNIEHIRTSSTMQVELNDPDKAFTITKSNSSEIQIVDSIDYTEWNFNVIPIKSGIHPLSIVSSIITTDGTKDKTYINTVFVKMNIVHSSEEFWLKEWKWLFTTLIIPFIVWFYNKRKKKD